MIHTSYCRIAHFFRWYVLLLGALASDTCYDLILEGSRSNHESINAFCDYSLNRTRMILITHNQNDLIVDHHYILSKELGNLNCLFQSFLQSFEMFVEQNKRNNVPEVKFGLTG